MTSLETADLLTAEFPELAAELHAPPMLHSVYRQLDCFAAFTRRALRADRLAVLRHCFAVADSLLRHADHYLARAIENVYLHGLHLAHARPTVCGLLPPPRQQAALGGPVPG